MTGHKIVEEVESGVIPMSEMKPGQWAFSIETVAGVDKGDRLRRSSSEGYFIVDNMSNTGFSKCWSNAEKCSILVCPIPAGTRLTIEIT